MEWNHAVAMHDRAVTEYARDAGRVQSWMQPLAPGKWSAAETTTHLILAFEAVLREVAGDAPMQLRGTRARLFMLRSIIMPRIIRGGAFPRAAAPRETRPVHVSADAAAAIARFRSLGAQVTAALTERHQREPELRLTHPYFGAIAGPQAIQVSARHIDHHRRQLGQGKSHAHGSGGTA